MSDSEDDIDRAALDNMISVLEINVDNVYHLILSNGSEMVGELFPPQQLPPMNEDLMTGDFLEDSNEELDIELILDEELDFDEDSPDLLFLNPVKIYRETFMDEDGRFQHQNFFLEYNPCIDGPYTHINKNSVISSNRPNEDTLYNYLKTIYYLYYELLEDLPVATNLTLTDNSKTKLKIQTTISVTNNVIDFHRYHLNRMNGGF